MCTMSNDPGCFSLEIMVPTRPALAPPVTMQEEHLTGIFDVLLGSAPLADNPLALCCFPLLLLLKLLSCLLPQQGPELLLPLRGHESLLLGHGDVLVGAAASLARKKGTRPSGAAYQRPQATSEPRRTV